MKTKLFKTGLLFFMGLFAAQAQEPAKPMEFCDPFVQEKGDKPVKVNIYSEEGKCFTVISSGIKINPSLSSNVTFYESDGKRKFIIAIDGGDKLEKELTIYNTNSMDYAIIKNKKGKYELKRKALDVKDKSFAGDDTPDKTEVVNKCYGSPMSSGDFSRAVASLKDEGMESNRLSMAKQVVSTNCMSSKQVAEIVGLFSFSENQLSIAKYAYEFTTDEGNYNQVSKALKMSSDKTELNNYLTKLKFTKEKPPVAEKAVKEAEPKEKGGRKRTTNININIKNPFKE